MSNNPKKDPKKNTVRSDDRGLDKAKSKANKKAAKGGRGADDATAKALKGLGKLFGLD